ILGKGTEELAAHTGPKLSGFLNGTLGNAAELIITIFAIKEGLLDLVKASITGSILGNLLLVLGLSILLGGLRHGVQKFDRTQASVNATMLILALIALGIPSLFSHSIEVSNHAGVEYLSLGTAAVMILIYALSVVFSFQWGGEPELAHEVHAAAGWSVRKAVTVLLVATFFIAWLSEILVGTVEHTMQAMRLSEFFVGIIIVPLIGNVAEHLVAVTAALKNRMELSMSVSIGSSLQVALFVAPALVFLSLLMGNPLTLEFNQFELVALGAAALIAASAAQDGESNWLEGAQLLVVYVIIGLAFFYLPM
ncbi:MAG: calcium/proton exchanger, partial [Anaerolineae bacterium]